MRVQATAPSKQTSHKTPNSKSNVTSKSKTPKLPNPRHTHTHLSQISILRSHLQINLTGSPQAPPQHSRPRSLLNVAPSESSSSPIAQFLAPSLSFTSQGSSVGAKDQHPSPKGPERTSAECPSKQEGHMRNSSSPSPTTAGSPKQRKTQGRTQSHTRRTIAGSLSRSFVQRMSHPL